MLTCLLVEQGTPFLFYSLQCSISNTCPYLNPTKNIHNLLTLHAFHIPSQAKCLPASKYISVKDFSETAILLLIFWICNSVSLEQTTSDAGNTILIFNYSFSNGHLQIHTWLVSASAQNSLEYSFIHSFKERTIRIASSTAHVSALSGYPSSHPILHFTRNNTAWQTERRMNELCEFTYDHLKSYSYR